MVLNLGILLLIETKWPEFVAGEWTAQQERIDVVYTILIGWCFIPGYVYLAKSSYIREYLNAKRSEKLKTSFLANMSHEIRTPLNAIMGFSEIIKEDEDQRGNELFYDIIHSNSIYLYNLIDQVLNLSLIDSGYYQINKVEISTKLLMERLEQEILMQLKQDDQKGDLVSLSIEKPDIRFFSDEVKLQQIIRNLSSNAVKFTDVGQIQITLRTDSNRLYFSIKDTGPGIPEDQIDSIFDRFVKIHNYETQYSSRGVGLGLYISKKIVNHLGGEIGVKSKLGKGSEFWFYLPL
jgi:signal transduction histidine kinase